MHALLASEGFVPPDHVAANFVVPIAFVIFGGSIFMFLWANYGARKGMAIFWTSLGGFCTMLGVFWWFGAPGTPVATGLQNLPGQAADEYQPEWFGFQGGSERAEFFSDVVSEDGNFVSPAALIGGEGATEESLDGNKQYSALTGDLQAAADRAEEQFYPIDEFGTLQVGAERRTDWAEQTPEPEEGWARAEPFYSPVIDNVLVTEEGGTRIAKVEYRIEGAYIDATSFETVDTFDVETNQTWYAFKDPGALWFPSALWTGISFLIFAGSLFWLDRIEMSEKEDEVDEVREPEDLAVPVAQ